MVNIGCVIKTPGNTKNNKTGIYWIKSHALIVTIAYYSVQIPV